MRAVEILGDEATAERVLREAAFRVLDLPKLDPEYQKQYRLINNIKD